MEIPASLLGAFATEGEIFFFEKGCPVGIDLARIRRWDNRTYPVISKSAVNKLMRDSYVNCNEFVELTEDEFGNLTRRGLILREVGGGTIPEADMIRIREGIDLSVNISDEDKDRILR